MKRRRPSNNIVTRAVGAAVIISLAGCSSSGNSSSKDEAQPPTTSTTAAPTPTTLKANVALRRYAQTLLALEQRSLAGNVTSDELLKAAEELNFVTPPVGFLRGHQQLRQDLLAAGELSGAKQKAAVAALVAELHRLVKKADPAAKLP